MKIAFSAIGNTPTSNVVPFSVQNAGFVVYDSDNFNFTFLDNPTDQRLLRRNGFQSAQMIVDAGIEVLIVGGIALETAQVLGRAGVKIYECLSVTVWEAIQALKLNMLVAIDNDSGRAGYQKVSAE